MLQKIRDKSQGAFAWVILALICIPFALWGIQNYVGGGSEAPVAKVGDKEFFQQDVNQAYAQYAQNLAGMNIDEEVIKQQALDKLIKDEVLLQYAKSEGLIATDEAARDFVKSLEYFQTDGKFDKQRYKALLGSQQMSSIEFTGRIKNALVMEQLQKAVVESGFATKADIENFFSIQNQQRDIEYLTIPLQTVTEIPSDEEISAFYQLNQGAYRTDEQVAIEYVELSLDSLAQDVSVGEQTLKDYYEEQKDLYTSKERRKISHILFAFNKDAADDSKALARAVQAKEQLKEKDFAELAAEISDDKLTAKIGGDLGLFNVGVMEQAFEDAAASLQLNEVSEPVKSAFGYHLIKVTELVPGTVKPFEEVKAEITDAYKKTQAETRFFELSETLTEVSYENPDSLQAVADALGVAVNKTKMFTRKGGNGIAAEEVVRNAAFSEDVLKGNNSEPVELGVDKLVVLRMLEYKPADNRPLTDVKQDIIATLQDQKARALTVEKAKQIKVSLDERQSFNEIASVEGLKIESIKGLTRNGGQLSWAVNQAVFKAPKPVANEPVVVVASDPDGSQTVIRLLRVKPGVISDSDKKNMQLAEKNMAKAFSQATFNAVLSELQANAGVVIRMPEND
jgi:peptidyl-prolyl cis-trans isomerase D